MTINDFGVLETRTINFEFYLNAARMSAANNEMDVDLALGLRENGKELSAEVVLNIPLPRIVLI